MDNLRICVLENAVFLCEDDRWTMLLLFLARVGYNSSHEKLFDEFHELEKEVRVEEQKLFDKLPADDHEKRFIGHIIQSEHRRLYVLEAFKIGDVRKARTLMWETIEIAYHERPAILECFICSPDKAFVGQKGGFCQRNHKFLDLTDFRTIISEIQGRPS